MPDRIITKFSPPHPAPTAPNPQHGVLRASRLDHLKGESSSQTCQAQRSWSSHRSAIGVRDDGLTESVEQ
eukprot:1831233-Prymnesium_polylepis.1